MAKAEVKSDKKELAPVAPVNVIPADVLARMRSEAGGGLSKSQDDNLVPLIYLLQPGSPQVKRGDPQMINGAKAGDIWLRSAEEPIIDGEQGMVFQPCHFNRDYVEWQPNRGGYVDRHDDVPADAEERIEMVDGKEKKLLVRKSNGNIIVDTRYHVGFVCFEDGRAIPYIIPLSSTGHSFSREWMFKMNSQTDPEGYPIDKSWCVLWRLKTVLKTKGEYSWYKFEAEKERMINSMDEYERGKALHDAFAAGTKKAQAPEHLDAA